MFTEIKYLNLKLDFELYLEKREFMIVGELNRKIHA